MYDRDRGRISAQVIEAARQQLNLFDVVDYGTITFHIKKNNVWRVEVTISRMLKSDDREEK